MDAAALVWALDVGNAAGSSLPSKLKTIASEILAVRFCPDALSPTFSLPIPDVAPPASQACLFPLAVC